MSERLLFDCLFEFPTGFKLQTQFSSTSNILALTGPSGSGKTTILNLIAGLYQPQCGTITLGNTVFTSTRDKIFVPPHKRGIGVLFQDHRLFPHMNCYSNLLFGRHHQKMTSSSLEEVVEELELQSFLRRFPRELSGGQRQRVALGRALLSNPSLLLLDEPMTSIEPQLQEKISRFIKKFVAEKEVTTLLVSHTNDLVTRLADEVFAIDAPSPTHANSISSSR